MKYFAVAAFVIAILVFVGMKNNNNDKYLSQVSVNGRMSIKSTFCENTETGKSTGQCWESSIAAQITNNSPKQIRSVLIKVDFFDCEGIEKSKQNSNNCRAVANVQYLCKDIYIKSGSKSGCTDRSYTLGSVPFNNDDWTWYPSVIEIDL